MMMGMGLMGMPPGMMGMGPAGMGPGMMGGPPRPGMMGPPMPPGGVLSPPSPHFKAEPFRRLQYWHLLHSTCQTPRVFCSL